MDVLVFVASLIKFLALSIGVTSLFGLSLILFYLAYVEYRHTKRKHRKPRSRRAKEEAHWADVERVFNDKSNPSTNNVDELAEYRDRVREELELEMHKTRRDGVAFGPVAAYGSLYTPRYANSRTSHNDPMRLAVVRPIREDRTSDAV